MTEDQADQIIELLEAILITLGPKFPDTPPHILQDTPPWLP